MLSSPPLYRRLSSTTVNPTNGNKKTEVKVLYDNDLTFRPFYMITNLTKFKEITNRDVFGVSDHFSVSINGFNDGQQVFFVAQLSSNGLIV
jgi:hypothetical protein